MKALRIMALIVVIVGPWLVGSSFAQTWEGGFQEEELASLPVYLRDFAVSKQVVNGNIYVFGGVDRDGKVSDRIFRYAVFTGQWSELPFRMPYPYTGQNASAVLGANGKLYLGPGFSSMMRSPIHAGIIECDPVSGTCVEVHSFDTPRGDVAVEQGADGMIYFFGGWDGLGMPEVFEFNPLKGDMEHITDLNFARGAISTVLAGDGNIYLFGGDPSASVIEMFDTKEKQMVLQSATLPMGPQEVRGAPLIWNAGGDNLYVLLRGRGEIYTYNYRTEELTSTLFRVSLRGDAANIVVSEDGREVYLLQSDPSRKGVVRLTVLRYPMHEVVARVERKGTKPAEKRIIEVEEEQPGEGTLLLIGGGYSRMISPKQLTEKPTSFTGVEDNLSGGLDSPGLISGFTAGLQLKFRIASWLRFTTTAGVNQWRSKTPLTSGTQNVGQVTSTISNLLVGLGPEIVLFPSGSLMPYFGGEAFATAIRTEAKFSITDAETSKTTQMYIRGGASAGVGVRVRFTSGFGLDLGAKYYVPNLFPKKTENNVTEKFETIVRDPNSLTESRISFLSTFGAIYFSF